jgi:Flp pilus assembly protein TadB
MPERENPGIASEVEAAEVINSVVSTGSSRSIVDTLMAAIPPHVQSLEEAQGVIEQLRRSERQYLPLVRDLQQSSLGNDVQRHLPRMMLVLFLVGLAACLSLVFGVIAFVIAAIVFIFYLAVRWRVIREMRAEAARIRDDLVKYGTRLITFEKRLTEQEKTA